MWSGRSVNDPELRADLLAARDARAELLRAALGRTVLMISANLPGPDKFRPGVARLLRGALEQLRQAAETRPVRYKVEIALARFYLEAGHLSLLAAEAHAIAAMRFDPGRVDPYAVLALVYADRDEWDRLDSTLTIALQEVPDDPAPHYRAAERLAAAGRDPVRAERYLRLYLSQEPEGNQPSVSEARWMLGMALEAQGRVAEALAEFRESVRLDPESKAALELKRTRNSRPAGAPNSAEASQIFISR